MRQNVAVVIVTYGERYTFVSQVIKRLLTMHHVRTIVLVNNGNSKRFETFDKRLLSVDIPHNSGSANGYYEGLKRVDINYIDYVWMLDDDNLPNKNSLECLLNSYKQRSGDEVFSAFREDRTELKDAGKQAYIKNAFFEFSILKKIRKKVSKKEFFGRYISCETVPYGGLLLPTGIFKKIGFPNRDFYLYSDDNDYTYRLTKLGYKILCDTYATIKDLESSWYRREEVPMFKAFFVTPLIDNGKYTIRNRVYFEVNNIVTNKFSYMINIIIYLTYVFFRYMPKSKEGMRRYFIILKMIYLGLKGELGKLS
ncbi:glycosyltransferase [Liquorilactobacillus uvarum]|uniref:Glycosyltransferase 2-like domain-containing protein n=1 Tax=Liquorilactobacillus uvarum DSM 19971 TaxID=1423812 RepID=A0A0R1PVY8_9LACO|nr:glycosyltransferase [Liquorilactobacillus uvarum]KRL36673.1 hypothetical protein FD20_GL001136 [Liquorilactobacillus uvarum DSM 19971]